MDAEAKTTKFRLLSPRRLLYLAMVLGIALLLGKFMSKQQTARVALELHPGHNAMTIIVPENSRISAIYVFGATHPTPETLTGTLGFTLPETHETTVELKNLPPAENGQYALPAELTQKILTLKPQARLRIGSRDIPAEAPPMTLTVELTGPQERIREWTTMVKLHDLQQQLPQSGANL